MCRFCEEHRLLPPGDPERETFEAQLELGEEGVPPKQEGVPPASLPLHHRACAHRSVDCKEPCGCRAEPLCHHMGTSACSNEGTDDACAGRGGAARRYRTADMAAARFADLARLRLGAFPGYVFCHQGCCEHSLFFRDVRRIHAADSRDPAAYPQLVYQVRTQGWLSCFGPCACSTGRACRPVARGMCMLRHETFYPRELCRGCSASPTGASALCLARAGMRHGDADPLGACRRRP